MPHDPTHRRPSTQGPELVFQPQACMANGRIVGLQAMLRPGTTASADWVLRRACVLARKWQRQGLAEIRVTVAVSARLFATGDLAGRLERLVQETGLEPRRLGLEVCEADALPDIEHARVQLQRLRELGIETTLGGFGAEHASLGQLRRLPIDIVRIDRSLVPTVDDCVTALPIARAIVAMAHSLGVKVLAEGVSNGAELELLASCGCDMVQGAHVSPAASADEVEAMLRADRRMSLPDRRRAVRVRSALVVDGDWRAADRIRQCLQLHFGEVLEVTVGDDAQDGLQQLRRDSFDLVISGLDMPGTDGIAFLETARRLQPKAVRVMLLGACELERVLDDPRQVDVFRYIRKPTTPDQFRAHVQAALNQVGKLRADDALFDDARTLKVEPDTALMDLIALEQAEPGITTVAGGALDEMHLPSQLLTMPGDLWVAARPAPRRCSDAPPP